MNRKQLGNWGENLAAKTLQERGYTIMERNYRTPYGEMDIICRNQEAVVFVEVKTRTNRAYGYPEDAITAKKRAHLEETALSYLQEHPEVNGAWRIDVISIEVKPGSESVEIEWFENAI